MHLILEGSDCCGKSTVIEKIKDLYPNCKTFDINFVEKKARYGISTARRLVQDVYFNLTIYADKLIFDRHILSNIIYSKIYKQGNFRDFEEYLYQLKDQMLIVILTISEKELIKRLKNHEHFIDISKMLEIRKEYLNYAERLRKKGYNVAILKNETKKDFKNIIERLSNIVSDHLL